MKSKELKNYNLPDNRTFNETLDAKPMTLLLILMGIGFVLLINKRYIYGGCLFFVSSACLMFLPSRRLIEFYDDFMIMYNKARKDECNIIYYDDIKSWEYKISVSSDRLVLTLKDNSIQTCDAYSKTKFEECMNKYCKDKRVKTELKKKSKKKGEQ